MAAWIDDKALGRKYSGRQLIFSWLGGKQRAPSICSTLYRNPRRSLCWKYRAAHICAGEATSQRWVAQFAQFRSAQACRVHRRDEAPHTGRKQHPNPPKAALKQRLNPFMWGLFLCPEWRMHVWAPTVSKCWYKGRKPAASKHESKKKEKRKTCHMAQDSRDPRCVFILVRRRAASKRAHLQTMRSWRGWWKPHY